MIFAAVKGSKRIMKLTISRRANDRWAVDRAMRFNARSELGDHVTVDVSQAAWSEITAHWAGDPIGKLEELASDRRSHWGNFGAGLVWRVYL